jgi:hypothetical protein
MATSGSLVTAGWALLSGGGTASSRCKPVRRALVSAKACVHAVCDASRRVDADRAPAHVVPLALAAWIGHARLSSGGRD